MNFCLYCDEWIDQPLTWTTLFFQPDPTRLCEACQRELAFIKETFCHRCGRELAKQDLCKDCKKWSAHPMYRDTLEYNRALFSFNTFTQSLITQWKYRGDYQLHEIFSYPIKKRMATFYLMKKLTIVPIPLTEERRYERAFNQTEVIANLIGKHYRRPISHVLKRNPSLSEKQSKKSRQQRISSKNPFYLTNNLETSVLLVDDIYTTGMTIHHAASLLKKTGCPAVYSFTLLR